MKSGMIRWTSRQVVRAVTAVVLVATLVVCTSANSYAQAAQQQPPQQEQSSQQQSGHVVSPADMQQEAAQATGTRQQNEEDLNDFFSSPQAEQALQSAHMDSAQVKSAVSNLNDQELAKLSARASAAQTDFAAGALSNRDLIWIVVIVAVIILIIVAVR
jgi:hypothetical protein